MSTPVEEKKNNIPAEPASVPGPAAVPGPSVPGPAAPGPAAPAGPAAPQPKSLQEYMDEIKKNQDLINRQQKIITGQITQGENVLNALRSSLSLTTPKGQTGLPSAQTGLPSAQTELPSAKTGLPSAPAGQQVMNPIEPTNSQVKKLEEEAKKERKKDEMFATPKIWKGDWEKRKSKHDEKIRKSREDIAKYEEFISGKSEDEIKKLESQWEIPGIKTEFQVLREAKIEAEEFIKHDAIPRAALDKKFAQQREARRNVLLNFDNELKLLNTEKENIIKQLKENIKKKQKYIIMSDEEKDSDPDYANVITDENNLKNQKLKIENDIKMLTDKKNDDLKPIDDEISKLKTDAKEKKIGGKITRKRRTKNLKRKQSRKYRGIKA